MDNTQKLHVSDPLIGRWTTNDKSFKKKKKEKETAIHHDVTHPWFILQAQVSVIQLWEDIPAKPGSNCIWKDSSLDLTVMETS